MAYSPEYFVSTGFDPVMGRILDSRVGVSNGRAGQMSGGNWGWPDAPGARRIVRSDMSPEIHSRIRFQSEERRSFSVVAFHFESSIMLDR